MRWVSGLPRKSPPLRSVAIAHGDGVGSDPARTKLLRETTREHLDDALHRCVGGRTWKRDACEDARQVDNAATVRDQREHLPRQTERTLQRLGKSIASPRRCP
jgi:hypothetical protein